VHRLFKICAIAVLALWPSLASAAIIGPTDDWMPLRQGAHALGISGRMVDRILAAGLEVLCPGTTYDNGGVLNGWFLGGDATSFYTNAHGIIDISRSSGKSNFIEPLDQCVARSYMRLGSAEAFQPIAIPQNRHELQLATFTPQDSAPSMDRARLHLLHSIAGARALALPDFSRIHLSVGDEVIMVSLRPPKMHDTEIQACHIQALDLGGVGQLFTDCDNGLGNSAGLYFVRDPKDRTMLLPIALHEGCHERLGDHQPWDLERNTALGIMLRQGFFAFRGRS
jgi:hypothetical protein